MFLRVKHNPDSDESISDEDDDVCPNNVSSSDPTNNQELPLPVRLDILKGISNQNLADKGNKLSSTFEKPPEDEVEMSDFKEGNFDDISGEVVANSTDEEINSADEGNTITSIRQLHRYGPQSIRNEQVRDTMRNSEAFLRSKESVSHSAFVATCSKANTTGIWRKTKKRFLLPSVSHKHEPIGSSVTNIESLPEIVKAVDPMDSANFDGNYHENDGRMEIESDTESAESETLAHGFNLPSMADLFDNLQDKTDLCFQYDSQRKGKMVQPFQKNGRFHLQDTVVDSKDFPEPVDSGSSSDNEVADQHMKIISPRKKMQTMVERFDEALGSSSVISEGIRVGAVNSLRAGIFGKLEVVMQKEKERDMDFWKKLQSGARPDSELGCIVVKIIMRYLDGRLTICHCSFGKSMENFLLQDNYERMEFGGHESDQKTIIFNPRVCNNVHLEVGNMIRIHPPWKEVQVGNDNIVLCTYFSEILSPDLVTGRTIGIAKEQGGLYYLQHEDSKECTKQKALTSSPRMNSESWCSSQIWL